MPICSIEECAKPVAVRGWCHMHYARWQRHGDPTIAKRILGDTEARFLSKVAKGGPDDCWLWQKSLISEGYGRFAADGQVQAHRWSYEHWHGPIPEGWNVDHLCHNRDTSCKGGPTCMHRRCVNPAHLGVEPTTTANSLNSPNAKAYRTHCPQGHPYNEANTHINRKGDRICRACWPRWRKKKDH